MFRMIQLSLIAVRIAQRGRISAANSAFVGPQLLSHQKNTVLGRNRSSSAIFSEAILNDEDDSSTNPKKINGKIARNISTGAGATGNIVTPSGRRYQSRLASIYDETFADDEQDNTNVSKSSPAQPRLFNSPRSQGNDQQQPPWKADDNGYKNFDPKPKNVDFDLDDDYPQDFHVQNFKSEPSPPSSRIAEPPRRKPLPIRQPPAQSQAKAPRPSASVNANSSANIESEVQAKLPQMNAPPPRAQTPATFENGNNTPENEGASDSASSSSAKLAPIDVPPPKARMVMGRRMPPPVMEYDYSHYDEEFGARKAGEGSYIEFHDGMLDGEETIDMTPSGTTKQPNSDELKIYNDEMKEEKGHSIEAVANVLPEEKSFSVQKNIAKSKIDDNIAMREEANAEEKMPDRPNEGRDEQSRDTKKSWRNRFAKQSQMMMPPRPISKPNINVEVAYSAPTGGADPQSVAMLESLLEQFQEEMFSLNDGKKFNIKSPKQVSIVLFGVDNESTNKDALDAIAGNVSDHKRSRLASLVLKYRKTLSQIKRLQKTKENKANGTHTTAFDSMKKGNGRLNAAEPNANIDGKASIGHYVSPMSAGTTDEEPLVLVDASAYIFRAYYSMPPMHRNDGEPIGATLGFCNMLNKLVLTPLLQGKRPRIVLVFDSKSGTNFRKKIYPKYKANRSACPEDLIPQFDFVRDAADAYGILQLEAPGFEADDVIATIGTMAVKEGCYVNILSGDKDLMQLVTKSEDGGACIEMIDPMKMVRFCHETVVEKWGVEPHLLGDILALAGDSADNIPGVPGIGPKIAASLIQEFGSLDKLLDNVEQVKQKGRQKKLKENAHLARLSRELVELERNISLQDMSFPAHFQSISDIRMESFDKDRLIKFYERMGLHELKRRITSRLPKEGNRRAPSVLDRYASITDQGPGKNYRGSKSGIREENNNGFSPPSTFTKPPTPEDFSDVPF